MSAIKSDRPSRGPRLRLGIISNELHRRGEGDFLLLVQQTQSLLEVFERIARNQQILLKEESRICPERDLSGGEYR